MAAEKRSVGTQDTGNPVLDSTVNLVAALGGLSSLDDVETLHEMVLRLSQKEPGGLKARSANGALAERSDASTARKTERKPLSRVDGPGVAAAR